MVDKPLTGRVARRFQIPLACPPPPNFREAGELEWAELRDEGPFGAVRPRPATSAQAAGLRYERKAHRHLSELYPRGSLCSYGGGPWIAFKARGSGALRWAQPDGFIVDFARSIVIVVECKIKHSTVAWWGLRALYEPVCTQLFGPSWRIALCEVVCYFEPGVTWPETFRMLRDPSHLKAGEIGVHIWRAR